MSLFGGGEKRRTSFSFLLLLHAKETKYELFLEFNDHIINTSKKTKVRDTTVSNAI